MDRLQLLEAARQAAHDAIDMNVGLTDIMFDEYQSDYDTVEDRVKALANYFIDEANGMA